MRQRLHGIEGPPIGRGFGVAALASLGMGIILWFWIQATGNLPRWVAALGGVALGGMIYGFLIAILKVPEMQSAIRYVARRVKP